MTRHPVVVAFTGASALASNFDPSQPYSWMIVSSFNTTNFDPTKFAIDATQFTNSLAYNVQGNGSFRLSLGGVTGQSLMLSFAPVPEPSTWVLLVAGLGVVSANLRRRCRRR